MHSLIQNVMRGFRLCLLQRMDMNALDYWASHVVMRMVMALPTGSMVGMVSRRSFVGFVVSVGENVACHFSGKRRL